MNTKLSERLVTLYYPNEQYSMRECLEISGIPASVADNGLESSFGNFRTNWRPNRLATKGSPKKVVIKLNRRKDIRRILLNKIKLKNLKPESQNLPEETKVFINENLSLYYKKLWSKCKKLWGAGHISPFWVSKRLLRIELPNEINVQDEINVQGELANKIDNRTVSYKHRTGRILL